MGIRRKTDTPEANEFWDFVDRTAESVEKNFPPWKIGGHKMTKLTNDEINQMAAELLGLCWHPEFKPHREHPGPMRECVACEYAVGTRQAQPGVGLPDFIRDANAVRELVVWLKWQDNFGYSRKFKRFLENELDLFESLYALAETSKNITLAVLYAVGKITLEQAREAMEGDNE